LTPGPEVSVTLNGVVPRAAVAEASADAAAGSAALEAAEELGVAAEAVAPGVPPSVLQPATATATVAIIPRPSPVSRRVRMSVPPAVPIVR
jgi:hypothetical protein